MNMRIDTDDFYEELDRFEEVYDEVFQQALPLGMGDNMNDVWRATRDAVLPQFPLLEYLYRQHGIYRNVSYDDQPHAAKLGRKIAGVMSSTLARYDNASNYVQDCEEEEEVELLGESTLEKIRMWEMIEKEDTLYVAPPSFGDAANIRRKHASPRKSSRSRPDRSDTLVQALAGMEKGQYARLEYQDENSLRKDQALLRIATSRLGWSNGLDDRYIPWESWMETEEDSYYMVVVRLEEPRLKRRKRK